MADENIRASLGVNVDDGSVKQGLTALEKVKKSFETLNESVRETAESLEKRFADSKLGKGLDSLTAKAKSLSERLEAVASKAKQGFDAARDVNNPNRGAASGAAGEIGRELASRAGGDIAGNYMALEQILPQIGAALPTTAAGLAALGAASVVAAPAVFVAGKEVAKYTKAMKDQAKALEAAIAANRQVAEQAADGMTSRQADQRLKDLEKQIKAEEALYKQSDDAYQGMVDGIKKGTEQYGVLSDLAVAGVKQFDDREQKLKDSLNQSKDNLQNYRAEFEELTEALKEGAFAANDMTESLLKDAEKAGELVLLEEQISTSTREANQERLKALEAEREAIQVQLDMLKASGDTSAGITERITELEQSMGMLDEETRLLNDALKDTGESSRVTEQQLKDAAKEQIQIQKDLQQSLIDLAESARQQEEDIARGLADTQKDMKRDLGRELTMMDRDALKQEYDIRVQTQRDVVQMFKDHEENLKKIQERGRKDREKLLTDGDFRAVFELEEALSEEMKSATDEFTKSQTERLDAQKIELQDARDSALLARQDRLEAYKQQVSDARENAERQRRDAKINYEREIQARNLEADRALRQTLAFLDKETQLKADAYGKQLKLLHDSTEKANQVSDRSRIGYADDNSSSPSRSRDGGSGSGSYSYSQSNDNRAFTVSMPILGGSNPAQLRSQIRQELVLLGMVSD